AGSDADHFLNVRDKNLAVAYASGLRSLADRLYCAIDGLVTENDLDLHLGEEVDHILRTAIEFGMALLPPKALCLGDGYSLEPGLLKRFLDLIELEWLDDCFDLLHCLRPP